MNTAIESGMSATKLSEVRELGGYPSKETVDSVQAQLALLGLQMRYPGEKGGKFVIVDTVNGPRKVRTQPLVSR